MSKEEILLQRANFSPIFVFLSILFSDFSRTGNHLKAKILEQGEIFFSWAHPRTNLGQVPPPPPRRYFSKPMTFLVLEIAHFI